MSDTYRLIKKTYIEKNDTLKYFKLGCNPNMSFVIHIPSIHAYLISE